MELKVTTCKRSATNPALTFKTVPQTLQTSPSLYFKRSMVGNENLKSPQLEVEEFGTRGTGGVKLPF